MDEKLKVRVGADIQGFKSGLKGATDFAVSSAKKIVMAFTGIITASALIGSKFEKEITNTATIAQAFGKDLEALEKKARDIGKTTAFTAAQAAAGMYDLASAGLKTREIIDATQSAMLLAGATASEMTQATHLLASSLRQFGMDASESKRIVDTFAAAITNSLLTMDKLTEAMKYAGTTGAAFKWSIEETTASVAMFANLGLPGTMAGTNLRMAMLTLSSQTDKVKETLKELGLTFTDVNPQLYNFGEILETFGKKAMTPLQAVTLFGTRAGLNMKQLIDLSKMGLIDYSAFVDKLVEAQEGIGRTAEMYERMQSKFLGAWKRFWSAMQELGITIFDLYKVEATKMFNLLAKRVNSFSDLVNTNANSIKEAMYDMAITIIESFDLIIASAGWVIKAINGIKAAWNMTKVITSEVIVKYNKKELEAVQDTLKQIEAEEKRRNSGGKIDIGSRDMFGSLNLEHMATEELKTIRLENESLRRNLIETSKDWTDVGLEGTKALEKTLEAGEANKSILESIRESLRGMIEDFKKGKAEIEKANVGIPFALGGTFLDDKKQLGSFLPEERKGFSFETPDISARTFQEDLAPFGAEAEAERLKKLEELIKKSKETEIEILIRSMEEERKLRYENDKKIWDTQKEFSQKFRDLGKDSYQLRIEEIKAEQQNYLNIIGDNKKMEVDINKWAAEEIKKIEREKYAAMLEIAHTWAGSIADSFRTISESGAKYSKEAFGMYKAFAIADTIITTISASMEAYKTALKIPYIGEGLAAAAAAATMVAGMAKVAMIRSQEMPSYDEGGISTSPGVYYSGVPEAHIPLKSGKVPVQIGRGGTAGNTVIVRLDRPVFQDVATQRRTMRMIAEEITMRLAPVAIQADYNNDGRTRRIIRGRS